jgi:hypothetical protein
MTRNEDCPFPMRLIRLIFIAVWAGIGLPLLAQQISPTKFWFKEKTVNYYLIAILDPENSEALKGFQLFNAAGMPMEFIPFEEDLSDKVAAYITGGVAGASPVDFEDCNFDGYPDLMMREDISPRYASFDIWLWNPKRQKFVEAKEFNDAGINRVDPKTRRLFAGGSEGHGDFGCSTYTISHSGRLVHLSDDIISSWKNRETLIYYNAEGKEVKKVVGVLKPLE